MKPSIVCLVLLSVYGAQGQMYGGEWMSNLFNNINHMNRDIQSNVMNMNQQLQENIRGNINNWTGHLQRTAAEGPAGGVGQGINFGANGGSIVINSVPGTSRTVVSGYGPDGQLYYRDTEETVVGNVLHHTEIITHPSLGTTNEIRYTLDLNDPTARPVFQQN